MIEQFFFPQILAKKEKATTVPGVAPVGIRFQALPLYSA